MATNIQIEQDLRASGIEQGELVVVHASLGSMGWVERGPETVIRALLNMIRPENTLAMSAMTHRLEPYDHYVTTTINMGQIADLFWRRPDARRSDHPNSSFAAEGPPSAEIVGMASP